MTKMDLDRIEAARRRLLACRLDAVAAQDRADAAKRKAEAAAGDLATILADERSQTASYNSIDARLTTA